MEQRSPSEPEPGRASQDDVRLENVCCDLPLDVAALPSEAEMLLAFLGDSFAQLLRSRF